MKIFISHQRLDAQLASAVAQKLARDHEIESYLDVVDHNLLASGDSLGEYLRREMGKCTQLIAVVSTSTRSSQWVPWEIGIATEKDFPLATYFGDNTAPPEFLQKWPYLRSLADVDQYAIASKAASRTYRLQKSLLPESTARRLSTADFFRTLRSNLGQ